MRNTNRTKYERTEVDHGVANKREVQLSNKAWKSIPALEYDESREHPTPEQAMIRQAVRYLTPKQKQIWQYHTYNQLTQDEIANKMNMKQPNVAVSIKSIEKRIEKWCRNNWGCYQLIKQEFGPK